MPTDPAAGPPRQAAVANPPPPVARPVAFVITRGDSIGGAQIHVRDLAARLVADGDNAVVLVGTTGPFTRALTARGVRWRICPGLARNINPLRDVRAIREVHRALLIERPRLVSCHTAKAGLVGRLAACWTGIPSLFTAHGWQFTPGIPPAQRLLVYTLELLLSRLPTVRVGSSTPRRSSTPPSASPSRGSSPPRVITVSRYDLRLARRTAAVPARGLRLVYNGLPEVAPATAPSPRVPTVVMVARFQAQKDHASLLRGLASVPGPWRCRFVGEAGPLFDDVFELARALRNVTVSAAGLPAPAASGVEPDGADDLRTVEFLGHRDDVAAILADADVYCLISHWEGLPRSIIEAMRACLPVVASDVGGVNELVRHGHTGILVPPRGVSQIATALTSLIGSRTLRQTLGAAARSRYESLFTFEAMYRHTRAVWNELTPPTS